MINYFESYYSEPYADDQSPYHSVAEVSWSFFGYSQLPKLNSYQKDLLTWEVTARELLEVISQTPNNKAPGPESYTIEFYKAFSTILLPTILRANSSSMGGESALPPSWLSANITVLFKSGKDPTVCPFYRPISPNNAHYTFFTQILANRIGPFLGTLIHTDQTGLICNRSGWNNIRRLLTIQIF